MRVKRVSYLCHENVQDTRALQRKPRSRGVEGGTPEEASAAGSLDRTDRGDVFTMIWGMPEPNIATWPECISSAERKKLETPERTDEEERFVSDKHMTWVTRQKFGESSLPP